MASAAYDFSNAPQSVPIKRNAAAAKYRDDEENMLHAGNNIMFDSRVVRGNTYAAQVVTQEQQRQQQVYNRNEKARQVRLTVGSLAIRERVNALPMLVFIWRLWPA